MGGSATTPDVDGLVQALFRRGKQKRLHFSELFLDDEIKNELWARLDFDEAASDANVFSRDDPYNLRREIDLHGALGYEIVSFLFGFETLRMKLHDDLIEDAKIDGKHSFEDEIMPVTEASRRYGSRIAIIGGKLRRSYNKPFIRDFGNNRGPSFAKKSGYILTKKITSVILHMLFN